MSGSDEDSRMIADNDQSLAKIPPTPTLARKLFPRLDMDGEILLAPGTDAERLFRDEPFHTTVSRLLFQAIPTLQLETINSTIKSFF